jgi:hypothetical protein
VKIIGKQSGGGACSAMGFVDACGSIYSTSSALQTCYLDCQNQFVHNDADVPIDHELDMNSWYDLPKLDAFVSSLGKFKRRLWR